MKQESGSASTAENLTERLKFFSFFVNLDKIAWVYAREKTPAQKEVLAKVYQDLTGINIESRLAHLGALATQKYEVV